jgi:hypothetical protein
MPTLTEPQALHFSRCANVQNGVPSGMPRSISSWAAIVMRCGQFSHQRPNTDDMRDAPSLVIVPLLAERGAIIRAYDPQGRKQAQPLLPDLT